MTGQRGAGFNNVWTGQMLTSPVSCACLGSGGTYASLTTNGTDIKPPQTISITSVLVMK